MKQEQALKKKNNVKVKHDKIKDYSCEICGARFPTKQPLKRHVTEVHENLPRNAMV